MSVLSPVFLALACVIVVFLVGVRVGEVVKDNRWREEHNQWQRLYNELHDAASGIIDENHVIHDENLWILYKILYEEKAYDENTP